MDAVMKNLNYIERLPVSIKSLNDHKLVKKWLKEKNMTAYAFFPPVQTLLTIDVLVEDSLKFGKLIKTGIVKKFDNVNIPVVSIDYLIKMKKRAARPKDLEDLDNLIKLKNL